MRTRIRTKGFCHRTLMIVHLGGNNASQGFILLSVGIVSVMMINCLQENAYNYIGKPKSLQNLHQCVPGVSTVLSASYVLCIPPGSQFPYSNING